jgi:uncharacterized protein
VEKRVYFRNPRGYDLSGLLRLPPGEGKRPLVVGCHGFGSRKDSPISAAIVHHLERLGIASLRFGFTGHKESGGDIAALTPTRGVEDLRAALDFVDGYQWVDRAAIGLVGHSFGGMVVLRYAATSDLPRCLALLAPVSDYVTVKMQKLGPTGIEAWRAQGYTIEDTDEGTARLNYSFFEDARAHNNYELSREIRADCLIYHGDQDAAVSVEQSKALATVLGPRAELRIVPGGNHGFGEPWELDVVAHGVAAYLDGHLRPRF